MFSPLRNRFGIPGVISVVALVFAMLGGAYAANNSSGGGKATASAKAKKGPRGPKGATGPAGPAGAQGPAGPAGAKGDNGANGTNGSPGASGTNGTNGQSVTVEEEPAIVGECGEQAGVELTSVSGTDYVCNGEQGEQGEPWTAGGTLPAGATETGAFQTVLPGAAGKTAISFPIPLTQGLNFAPFGASDVKVVKVGESPPAAECENTGHPGSAGPENPEANSGKLCIYLSVESEVPGLIFVTKPGASSVQTGTSTTGALLELSGNAGEEVRGTFAVTG